MTCFAILVFPSQPSTYDNVWWQAASKLQPYSNYGIQWLIFNPTTLKLMDIKIKKIERPLNISYSFYVKLDKIITINLPKTNNSYYIKFHTDQDDPSMTKNFQFLVHSDLHHLVSSN